MVKTGMALKKEAQEFMCNCTRAWSGEISHTHIEAVGLTGDDANNMKCILDVLEVHCIPKSNEILAATAYKQPVQGNLDLAEYLKNPEKSQQCATSAQYMINV